MNILRLKILNWRRIFNDVGNIDYIYTVIQECVDEVTEEQYMDATGDGMMDRNVN